MTKAQHTPGPWTVEEMNNYEGWQITGKHPIYRGGTVKIARVGLYFDGNPQQRFNARLIAAAPDYHEAAEHFPDVHDGRMSNDELMEAVRDWYAEYLQPAHAKAKATWQAA